MCCEDDKSLSLSLLEGAALDKWHCACRIQYTFNSLTQAFLPPEGEALEITWLDPRYFENMHRILRMARVDKYLCEHTLWELPVSAGRGKQPLDEFLECFIILLSFCCKL